MTSNVFELSKIATSEFMPPSDEGLYRLSLITSHSLRCGLLLSRRSATEKRLWLEMIRNPVSLLFPLPFYLLPLQFGAV
jgi:hypothetical protein